MKIFKYPIELQTEQVLQLPAGTKLLDIQLQHGNLQLWAAVHTDPGVPVKPVKIIMVGTGQHIQPGVSNLSHISTVQMGPFVWHFFEVKDNSPVARFFDSM